MKCPHCDHDEFTPVRRVNREREGAIARMVSALLGRPLSKRTGNIVCCARCTTQFVFSVAGVYKIRGTEPPQHAPSANGAVDQRRKEIASMADEDMDWS